MPGYSDEAKNLMLDELAANAVYVSLHTGDPGGNGADEVDDSGAYERVGVTWTSASEGEINATNSPEFDVPPSTTVTHFGLWSAASGGAFYGGAALSAAETFSAQGTFTLTTVNLDLNA